MDLRFGVFSTMCDSILFPCIACGLKCYTCGLTGHVSCTYITSCPFMMDRCFYYYNLTLKGCQNSIGCVSPISCCEGDLCNNAIPTGPSMILLLVSSAIITLFTL
uniref:UPAR/Ly6 domain-containing protein n=1 Tax=Monopterus albus TaxID=43700 RepID=A0A3Q3R6U2_MONAL